MCRYSLFVVYRSYVCSCGFSTKAKQQEWNAISFIDRLVRPQPDRNDAEPQARQNHISLSWASPCNEGCKEKGRNTFKVIFLLKTIYSMSSSNLDFLVKRGLLFLQFYKWWNFHRCVSKERPETYSDQNNRLLRTIFRPIRNHLAE